ncbi:universal stress protein [Streptomyces fructofermentans]|uniref:Stress-inducible protein n=1 Tax=Streptomyces fructofermentans TaxID=152141 RepID=A0A918KCT1_9ACTN|nr:universal stress protein [Streptomyces fructofermentans]GGX58879.1 stress-inducible protein [Streptomyces fructofermentans]
MSAGGAALTAGVDGSLASADAAAWAAREAERRGLALRLLSAGPRSAAAPSAQAAAADGLLDRTTVQLAKTHPGLDIDVIRADAPAVPALLAAAAESQTLVLGSRGLSGFTGFLVGSVAFAVAAGAGRPVVLVRPGDLPEDAWTAVHEHISPARAPYHPVVLGLDVDRPADELIAYAFEATAARAAPLHVVHAWSPASLRGYVTGLRPPADDPGIRHARERALAAALRPWRLAYPGTEVAERVVHGHPAHHLLKASARAGLLVVGRRVPAGPGLGRVAHSLVHHSMCAVAVVPHH